MKHTMLDLETMGNSAGCAVVSIGAIEFDPKGGLGKNFYGVIQLQSCLDIRLRVDASTVDWWLQQSDGARAALRENPRPIREVLDAFSKWLNPETYLWCHGLNFDMPILETAYRAIRQPVPWKFWNARDTRTVFDWYGVRVDRSKGTHHNALDDATTQALATIEAFKRHSQKFI